MKEEVKKKLDAMAKAVVAKMPEGKESKEMVDELMRLTKEYNIEPVELELPVKDVVKRYPISEAIEIVRCRTAIFFHSTCFWVVSKPTMANNMKGGALFETLEWYCDYMDNRDNEPDGQEKENKDTICAMIANVLSLPLDVFTDGDLLINVATYILDERNKLYSRLVEEAQQPREDTLEDAIANAAFEAEVAMSEEFADEVRAISAKRAGKYES